MKKETTSTKKLTRRDVLLGAGATATTLGIGGFAGNALARQFGIPSESSWEAYKTKEASPEAAAKAMASRGLVTRKSISTLAIDSDEMRMYRDAMGVLRARSESDPLHPNGWLSHATTHALYCASTVSGLQIHWSWLFLPWHRAYLLSMEKSMAAAIAEPTFALPYWDVSEDRQVPEHYWGDKNPLNDITRFQEPGDRIPDELMDMHASLLPKDFSTFGGYPYDDNSTHFTEGVMESSYHANVHTWVGGNLSASFLTAGFDPLFSGHHGNIDRVWSAWAAIPGREHPKDKRWLDTVFQFDNWRGGRDSYSIRDLLDTEALGYKFDTLNFTQPNIKPPKLNGNATTFAVRLKQGEGKAIANELRTGRRYVTMRFTRSQILPIVCPIRIFLGAEGEKPEYVATMGLLPHQKGGAKHLTRLFSMQTAVSPKFAGLLESGKSLVTHMEYLQLKGGRPLPVVRDFLVKDVEFIVHPA